MKENDEGGDQGDGGGLYRIEWMRGCGVLVTKWLTNRLLDIGPGLLEILDRPWTWTRAWQ